jgi:hypothetical protein
MTGGPIAHFVDERLFFLCMPFTMGASAQDLASGDLLREKVSDTILGHRRLVVPDPFNVMLAPLDGSFRQTLAAYGTWRTTGF